MPLPTCFADKRSKAKRTARRALQRAGQPMPDSLKPRKAVEDLPQKARKEAQQLQRRLKELRRSSRPMREVEGEISKCKKRLRDLFNAEDEYTYDYEEEEEVEEEEKDEEEAEAASESLKEAADAKAAALWPSIGKLVYTTGTKGKSAKQSRRAAEA